MTSQLSVDTVIAALVSEASGGLIDTDQALAPESDLQDLGLTSLAFLQLVDAIENELGVYVDLEGDTTFMRTVQGITQYIEAQRVRPE